MQDLSVYFEAVHIQPMKDLHTSSKSYVSRPANINTAVLNQEYIIYIYVSMCSCPRKFAVKSNRPGVCTLLSVYDLVGLYVVFSQQVSPGGFAEICRRTHAFPSWFEAAPVEEPCMVTAVNSLSGCLAIYDVQYDESFGGGACCAP